ncbi:MAG: aldehyde dehydrogenase family protein [Anaerolineales bacterium]|nr:aldehyde dehydrogenase family protein [Anaerolineales bacterium]
MDYQNFINGEWVGAKNGQRLESYEPATGEVIGTVPLSQAEDVDAAVAAAKAAYKEWRLVPAPARGEMLFTVAELLKRRKEEISQFLSREMGKVIAEARGDVQEAIDMAYYMGGEGRRLFGKVAPSELRHKASWAQRDPIGVAGLITPWNFPVAIPAWKMFPALVAGNTVVFKPAEDTPILAALLMEVMQEAGIPDGVVNMVTGDGPNAGNAIVEHPDVKVISFTGSAAVGRIVAAKGGKLLKKVSLELGGKNAVIVMDDANLDLVLDATIWGAFGTTGQRCTATSRVITTAGIRDELSERLVARAKQLRLGHGADPETDVGPLINQEALEKVVSYEQVAQEQGARLLLGGERAEIGGGFFYQPTIYDNVGATSRLAQEEIFGPVLSIIEADDVVDAIEKANSIEYGLSCAIFTQDVNRAFHAIRDLETGLCYVNHSTIGAEISLPFGGMKGTGNGGREAAWTALDTFTEWKSVYVDWSGTLQRAQIDNR